MEQDLTALYFSRTGCKPQDPMAGHGFTAPGFPDDAEHLSFVQFVADITHRLYFSGFVIK